MSQAGIIEFESAHPQVPTEFITNDGTAIPINNILEILGTIVDNYHVPLQTTGSGNTVTVVAQYAAATIASTTTDAGMASFNSANFTVDANGWVSLKGGGEAIQSVAVQTGISPIVPTAGGQITINGATVVAGTNPVRTDGTGANTLAVEVQISQAIAATNATNIGLSAFNSASFTVDPNGFVSLKGGGAAILSVAVQTGTSPIVPTAGGQITINGATVAAGTNPVRTDGTGANTMAVEVQTAQAIGATDATKIGLASFNSTNFTVDANGFVAANGSSIGQTITGNTGGALPPTAGNWNIFGGTSAAGTTPVTTSGAGSTLTAKVQISQAIPGTDATKIGLAAFNSADFSVDANGFVSATGAIPTQYTANSGTAVPAAGNLNILGPNSALTGYSPWTTATGSTVTVNLPGTVKWVVNATANLGTHTTIQAAINAASAGDDVFITPGTYTENLTLKNGVNLTAYQCDSTGSGVEIIGTCTLSTAGAVTISGVKLQTNSAPVIVVSGSVASILMLNNCTLTLTNNTGITYSSSSSSSSLTLNYCGGNLSTTGIALFTHTAAGQLSFNYCSFGNSASSTTASSTSGVVSLFYSFFSLPFSTSSAGFITGTFYEINTSAENVACITTAGTGTTIGTNCKFSSGTASCFSIGTGTTVSIYSCSLNSTNSNAFTGAGTCNYSMLSYQQTAVNNNVTTPVIFPGSAFQTINIQTFTSSGTYTPTAGMKYCQIEVVGGGGGGGGSAATGATTAAVGGGGGGGGYSKGIFTAATIGASQTVTIAAASAGGSGNATGTGGGTCSVGALITALGGSGGNSTSASTTPIASGGNGAGQGAGGSLNATGFPGAYGAASATGIFAGAGGGSIFGGGGPSQIEGFAGNSFNGSTGSVYGGGGGGALGGTNGASGSGAKTGGSGAKGIVIITEYI